MKGGKSLRSLALIGGEGRVVHDSTPEPYPTETVKAQTCLHVNQRNLHELMRETRTSELCLLMFQRPALKCNKYVYMNGFRIQNSVQMDQSASPDRDMQHGCKFP